MKYALPMLLAMAMTATAAVPITANPSFKSFDTNHFDIDLNSPPSIRLQPGVIGGGGGTNRVALDDGFSMYPASQQTNFWWDFGRTNAAGEKLIYASLLATNDVNFIGPTNGVLWSLLSFNIVASGANRIITVPTNIPHFDSDQWTLAGTRYYLRLTNGHEMRMSVQSNAPTSAAPTLSTLWTTFPQYGGGSGGSGIDASTATNIAAWQALLSTNSYPWGSLYDAAGAAEDATNGYPWSTLYQPADTDLTNWAALATSAKQDADADLTDLADGSLTGSKVGAGIPDASLSSNVPLLNAQNDFTGTSNTFSGPVYFQDVHILGTLTADSLFGATNIVTNTVAVFVLSNGKTNVTSSSVTTTELDYLDGVTSAIQTQFSGKQDADADLTDLADGTLTGSKVGTGVPDASLSSNVSLLGQTITGLEHTYPTNAFSGPTNTVTLNNTYQLYEAAGHCAVTNVGGQGGAETRWQTIIFSNSTASAITLSITAPARAIGSDTTNSLSIAAGKVGIASFLSWGSTLTNFSTGGQQ